MSIQQEDLLVLAPIREEIQRRAGGAERLSTEYPRLVRDAIDFVIDPVRTARTAVSNLDNVEKTFLGLKVEHFIRDFLDVPKGVRDLVVAGVDVDVKNTVGKTWMIPRETYSESGVCLVCSIDDLNSYCSLGLLVARTAYLGKPNRDQKRGVSAQGRKNVLWLVEERAIPGSSWIGLDMERFRELRKLRGGARRAAQFFRENLDRTIDRQVVQSLLFDQLDYMKRLRSDGGARDILAPEGITLTVSPFGDGRAMRG